ncbi:hypothetical protein MYO4S_00251 [Serratia phage 4S]|nr:hypothetical protein MYO4S_00251 [Serratia phage 4S]
MKSYNQFLDESSDVINENITTAVPGVVRLKQALRNDIGDAKFLFTTNNNKDGTGFAINTGQVYITWDADSQTAKIRQTRAAGGKSIDLKLNVAEKDVAKLVKGWMKTHAK